MYKCKNEKCQKEFRHTAVHKEFGRINQEGEFNSAWPTVENEYQVCPFCLSKEYEEIETPTEVKGRVISLKVVPHAQVDDMIKDGYELLDEKEKVWAKETALVKREKLSQSLSINSDLRHSCSLVVEPRVCIQKHDGSLCNNPHCHDCSVCDTWYKKEITTVVPEQIITTPTANSGYEVTATSHD